MLKVNNLLQNRSLFKSPYLQTPKSFSTKMSRIVIHTDNAPKAIGPYRFNTEKKCR
jgi:hypothetical protein